MKFKRTAVLTVLLAAMLIVVSIGAMNSAPVVAVDENAPPAGQAIRIDPDAVQIVPVEEARGVLTLSAQLPVTGSEPVDAAVSRLVNEAIGAFKFKADGEGAAKNSAEERMTLTSDVCRITDAEVDIVFETEVVHCGVTRTRRAAMTLAVQTGQILYASDSILPDLTLPKGKRIAFTFDDGPSKVTPYLLDDLAKRGYKATFFVVGTSAERYPEIIKRAYDEGHEIASHTYAHKNLNTLSVSGIQNQVQWAANAIVNAGVPAPTLVRPPYGNANSKVRGAVNVPLVNWSIDTLDWKYKDAARVERVILENAHDGSIVLCHDLYFTSAAGAINAMDKLAAEGYEFVTVSELLFEDAEPEAGKIYYRAPKK